MNGNFTFHRLAVFGNFLLPIREAYEWKRNRVEAPSQHPQNLLPIREAYEWKREQLNQLPGIMQPDLLPIREAYEWKQFISQGNDDGL